MKFRFAVIAVALLLAAARPAAAQHELKPLITVSADSWVRVEPDRCMLTAALYAQAPTAHAAHQQLAQKRDTLKSELAKLGGSLQEQGFTLAAKKGSETTTSLEQQLLIETKAGAESARAVDTLAAHGAVARSNLRCLVSDTAAAAEKNRAIAAATEQARATAAGVAKSLGVALGEVHSVVVTEDPAGAVLRARKLWGESAAASDEVFHIIVTTRFRVAGEHAAH